MSTLPSVPPRVMRGASGGAAGAQGYVPTPTAGQQAHILRGDGIWAAQPTGTIPSSTGNSGKILTTDGTTPTWSDTPRALTAVVNPRATRQALAFDGSSGSGAVETGGGRAFGTGDFTLSVWALFTNLSASGTKIINGASGSANLYITNAAGRLYLAKSTVSLDNDSGVNLTTGIWYHIVVTRISGTVVFYINGIATSSSANAVNYTGATYTLGYYPAAPGDPDNMIGSVSGYYPYNRALTAAEVLALYQEGVPRSTDYNSASNTALNTSAFINESGALYDTFTGATASGFTAGKSTAGDKFAASQPAFNGRIGTRYRVTYNLTLNSGALPASCYLGAAGFSAATTLATPAAGANSHEFTVGSAGSVITNLRAVFQSTTNGNYTISSFVLTPLGLLCAPDANQPGRGTVWQDVSGNNADLTLPASGVRWALPADSALTGVASVTSTALSNLTLGTGTFGTALTLASATGAAAFSGTVATNQVVLSNASAGYLTMGSTGNGVIGFGIVTNKASASYGAFLKLNSASITSGRIWNISSSGDLDTPAAVGSLNFYDETAAVSPFNLTGGALATGGAKVNYTTAATNTTSGALQVAGGMSAQGAAFFGGSVNAVSLVASGQLYVSGVGIGSAATRWLGTDGGAGWFLNTPTATNIALGVNNVAQLTISSTATTVAATTSASSSTVGAFLVGNGTAATNVAIGGGNVNAGGSLAIGNTVAVSVATPSTHKVTMVIGGVTYYLLASNV